MRKLDLVTSTADEGITLSSPHLRQRLVAVTVTFGGHTAGERLALRFTTPGGADYAAVLTGPITPTNGTAFFTIGAQPNIAGAATESRASGPLPWFWFTPDTPLRLELDNETGGLVLSEWRVLREVDEVNKPD